MELRIVFGWFFLILLSTTLSAATQCRSCDHVATPGDCETWTNCGVGEVCFTREFKETDGKQAFHLGCEALALCTLYLDAHNLGNIDLTTGDVQCYNCCLTDDCNKDLCTASLPQPTHATRPKVCPEFYIMIYSRCYFFGHWETSWLSAREYCKKTKDADLAAFNIAAENDQVNLKLVKLDAPVTAYWLGGFFSTASGEWEWVDRSVVTITLWDKGYPPTMNHTADYYITQPMPANGKASKWRTDTRANNHGFICEVAPA